MIKLYIGFHLTYPLLNFLDRFLARYSCIKFNQNPSVGSRVTPSA